MLKQLVVSLIILVTLCGPILAAERQPLNPIAPALDWGFKQYSAPNDFLTGLEWGLSKEQVMAIAGKPIMSTDLSYPQEISSLFYPINTWVSRPSSRASQGCGKYAIIISF